MLALGLGSGCLFLQETPSETDDHSDGFVPLFDGVSFSGWQGDLSLFRIEEQSLVGGNGGDAIAQNEFLCTEAEFDNFELKLRARVSREGANGGIQFRSRRSPNQSEVVGYQADLGRLEGEPPQLLWGALYDEARREVLLAVPNQEEIAVAYRPGDWNDFRIRAEGRRIRIELNGLQTVDYIEPDLNIPQRGVVGLQIHAGPAAEIYYRDIVLRPLPTVDEESP